MIDSFKPDLVVAHPPCTYLANSGVHRLYRWERFYDPASGPDEKKVLDNVRWKSMQIGAAFFARFLQLPVPMIAVENPIMHCYGRSAISKLVGYEIQPFYVQPWWFGDEAFKATGFTVKGLPRIVKPKDALVPPKPGTDQHREWTARIANLPPGPDRWKIRSRTFPGIANALAENWG